MGQTSTHLLCYNDVVMATGIDPAVPWHNNIQPLTKRQRHKAGKLTARLWHSMDVVTIKDGGGNVIRTDVTGMDQVQWSDLDTAENPIVEGAGAMLRQLALLTEDEDND